MRGLPRFEAKDMKKIILFFQESYAELRKVTWPSRDEAVASTRVVLISTIMIALMLGLVDFVLFKVVDWIFQ
jgi:preprotein translocase subunit SecE